MLSDKRVICGRNRNRCCFQWESRFLFVTRQRKVILLIEVCFSYIFQSTFCFAPQIVCKILTGASKSTSETIPHGPLVFEVNKHIISVVVVTIVVFCVDVCGFYYRWKFLLIFVFWTAGAPCLSTTVKFNYLSSPWTKAFFGVSFCFLFNFVLFVCLGFFWRGGTSCERQIKWAYIH